MQPNLALTDRFDHPRFTVSLCGHLPKFLAGQRWFTSKGKRIETCRVEGAYRVTDDSALCVIGVSFADGTTELYQLPLAQLPGVDAQRDYLRRHEDKILLRVPGGPFIVDAVPLPNFRAAIYALIRDGVKGNDGLNCETGRLLAGAPATAKSEVPAIDTSNTAIVYAGRYFFKLFRKLDPGLNPDLELVRYLSERTDFRHCPPYGGSIGVGEMHEPRYLNLGMLSGKLDNRGDAWEYFQGLTEKFFAGDLTVAEETLDRARLLGRRTAEMHRALSSNTKEEMINSGGRNLSSTNGKGVAPGAGAMVGSEAMDANYRAEISAAAVKLLDRQMAELADKLDELDPRLHAPARRVLQLAPHLRDRLNVLRDTEMNVDLIRIHADYHLGQVLVTDDDFYIIDFEGEPLLSIPERRRKRPALKDVAGMVRSFHYAARGQLLLNPKYAAEGRVDELVPHAERWFQTVSAAYLESYYRHAGDASFLPASEEHRKLLLDLFVLEKAIYEVAYELNSRPGWLGIPLAAF